MSVETGTDEMLVEAAMRTISKRHGGTSAVASRLALDQRLYEAELRGLLRERVLGNGNNGVHTSPEPPREPKGTDAPRQMALVNRQPTPKQQVILGLLVKAGRPMRPREIFDALLSMGEVKEAPGYQAARALNACRPMEGPGWVTVAGERGSTSVEITQQGETAYKEAQAA